MKTTLLTLGLVLAILQFAPAGGNSSIIEIDKVTSIEIQDGKVSLDAFPALQRARDKTSIPVLNRWMLT